MEIGKLIENIISTVSPILFIALVVGAIIAPFFESYIIVHPRLKMMVEYFGNVTLPNPPTPVTEKQERTSIKARR